MVTFKCPCGRTYCILERQLAMQKPFEKMRSFEASTSWRPSQTVSAIPQQPQLEISEATRSTPARPATIESDFLVPMLEAIGCAIAVSAVALGLTIKYKLSWWVPPAALGITFCGAWFLLLADTRKLLRVVETVIGKDIDGDGFRGEPRPEPEKPPLRIQVESEGGRVIRFDDLPVDEETMAQVAIAVLQRNCNLSKRSLAKETKLSEEKANELLDKMRFLGYARCKGATANAGTELTNKGRVLLEHLLS